MQRFRALAFFAFFCALSVRLIAQAPGTGLYNFGSFDNRGFDSINIGNLNVHFEIPIVSKPGRGVPFKYSIVYDGLIWSAAGASGTEYWTPDPAWGFHGQVNGGQLNDGFTGHLNYHTQTFKCFNDPSNPGSWYWSSRTSSYWYYDARGQQHLFNYATDDCQGTTTGDGTTTDGSGYRYDGAYVRTLKGSAMLVPVNTSGGSSTYTDTNGNTINNNGSGTFTDTLGTNALVVTGAGNAGDPRVFTYKVANQADGSTTASVTTTYHTYTVQTKFGCTDGSGAAIAEYGPLQLDLVDRITLADGNFYQFNYESTPGVSGTVTGRLASVTLPTGGTISYQYTGGCNGNGMNSDGTVGSLNRIADGTRQYNRAPNGSTTTLQDEAGNQTLYTFTNMAGLFFETQHTVHAGDLNAPALQDLFTCYNGTPANCNGVAITLPITQVQAISSQNAGSQKSITDAYDASGVLLTSENVLDYGGTLLRTMNYSYTAQGSVSGITVSDGSGNTISQATYGYDEQTPTPTSNLLQHNAAPGTRGNQTSAQVWVNTPTPSAWIKTSIVYDDAGQVLSTQDGRGNTTTYSYDSTDTFVTHVAYPVPGNGNSTVIGTSAQYDATSGVLQSTTDANNQTTTYRTYDRLLRPTEIDSPDGGKTSYNYYWKNGIGLFQTSVITALNSTTNADTELEYDGYGRAIRVAKLNGQAGSNNWNQVDYCYDPVGNIHFQATPYANAGFSASMQCSGTGTTFGYDALGRQTSATMPDGAVQSWSYNSNTATKQDEASHQWQYTVDGLGRTTKAIEPNSAETDYTYSGFTTTVAQKGVGGETARAPRSFTSDSLGRTVSVTAPESGTTTYGYDNNSNLTSTTDARGITTSHTYDALNRLTATAYSDGTPGIGFAYDVAPPWMSDLKNVVGRLANSANQFGGGTSGKATAATYSYDPMGRVIREWEQTPSASPGGYFVSMGYDLAGNMTSLQYPDGRVVTQGIDAGGNLQTVTFDNWNGQHVGYNYLSGAAYWADGSPHTMTFGNGATQTFNKNSRFQPSEIVVQANASGLNQTVLHNQYNYTSGCQSSNNGNIMQIVDLLNNARSQGFCYDNINRIASFSNGDGSMQQNYGYDSFGNLTQSGTQNFQVNYDANNHIMTGGYGYDTAGNLTQVNVAGVNTSYAFDAEGRMSGVNSGAVQYIYDPTGNRARKSLSDGTYTEYIYWNSQPIAEKHSDGTWSDYIYANGKMIARADNYDVRIHMSGTNCPTCVSNPNTYAGVTWQSAANGYTIRNGDLLTWRQYQDGSTTGGLIIWFTDHTEPTSDQDTDGQLIDQDTTMNTWHMRTVDLSQSAGKTIGLIDPFQWTAAPAGGWDIYYGDITLVSTDGTSIPIYSRTMQTLSTATNPAVSNFTAVTEKVADTTPSTTTTYYYGNQIGSSVLLTDAAGWPLASTTYYPFGQERTPSGGNDHYKFTGLERDNESGLDHAMFRQYSSTQGRWLSPDPYMGSYDLANPQSFNRYAYVSNNPMGRRDPSGLNEDDPIYDDPTGGFPPDGGGGGGGGGSDPCPVDACVTAPPNPPVDPGDPGPCISCVLPPTPVGPGQYIPPSNPAAPNNQAQPTACQTKTLNAINSQFGTNLTAANILPTSDPNPQANGGQVNTNFGVVAGLSPTQFNAIQSGRYAPQGVFGFLTGYGSSLHVVAGPSGLDPSANMFGSSNIGGMYSVGFTAHFDSAWANNPIGAFLHWLIDVRDHGAHRQPC